MRSNVIMVLLLAGVLIWNSPLLSARGRIVYDWQPLYIPHYAESYAASNDPVIALAYAKEDTETDFRVCAAAVGDGEIMLVYGEEGDPVEFHNDQLADVCAYSHPGWGGDGVHANHLDVYLTQFGKRPAHIERPVIKVGK